MSTTSKVAQSLPSNRVAALGTFLAGLGGLGTSLAGVWPNHVTQEIAMIAGSIATIAGPISHVIGSWLWDRTPAGQAAGFRSLTNTPSAPLNESDFSDSTGSAVDVSAEEFGGSPNPDYAPDSAGAPEPESPTGPTIQKMEGEQS